MLNSAQFVNKMLQKRMFGLRKSEGKKLDLNSFKHL